MITSPLIEQLAFKGKCRWTVQWFGINSSGTINVPDGGFVLLRQIIHTPFNQFVDDDAHTGQVHQLTLTEQGATDELQYIFRDPATSATAGTRNPIPQNNQLPIETWAIFKRPVEVDLINAGSAGTFSFPATTQYAPNAQERPTPLGFGTNPTGIPIEPFVDLGSGAEPYYQAGQKRPFTGATYAGAGVRDRLRWDVIAGREITPPTNDLSYPIIGFGMWVFNIPVSEYLNY